MNNINQRLQNVKKLQAKRFENEDHWDEINDLLIKELDEILLIELKNTAALINIGAVYSDMGENERALDYLKTALKLGSDDKNLFINLAIVMVYMEMHQEEYHEYLETAENMTEDPLTFKAYFDPQSH
ncbi:MULTISPECIES: tetratricopeptide repeat protein [Chryseobacterium]|uniref:Tetratricopeptide (TPR) repeat protein n=1 Tax=Chryseobacterium geocarposphaerae TaxID=1416776 RepID=A0ABU1LDB2_9FLAO|nr:MULTISPECIES: tetratricopeptide repeat protein [Chryseobacterium]MDR6404702.1 tetratricopeptide (TPR) repeat protein [Chryseobacterium geocarposphaerae]MDR6698065.1 tetratricopeptide (TPR) repeat protein [Chryseobacterium ginsenosidimutans]